MRGVPPPGTAAPRSGAGRTWRFAVSWTAGLVLWAVALAAAAPRDLAVSAVLARPGTPFPRLVYYLGELPGWLAVAGALVVLVDGRWLRVRARLEAWRPAAAAVLLQTAIQPVIVTWALKLLWGRVRYVDLAPGAAGYTPFFVPAGVGRGESFPSGHVAKAMVWAPLPFVLWRWGRRGAALALAAALVLYGAIVAWGRIAAGSHYLTDCLFSFGLALLLAPVLERRTARTAPGEGVQQHRPV